MRTLRRVIAAPFLVVPALVAAQATHAPSIPCASLRELRLPDVRITEVTAVAAGTKDAEAKSAFCRVSGVTGKAITFAIALPEAWNERLFMGGNGGFAGYIDHGSLGLADQGYVALSTDTGHEQGDGGAGWAYGDPEKVLDYGHVGVHRAVEVAKVVAKAYYGLEPRHSYFLGCSNGGRQALMEAQRYPDDFDGIVAGAPAAHFTRIAASFLKNTQATYPNPRAFATPIVTQANLDLLSAKVLEACDALDGVKDGILDDPRECRFKLASIKSCVANAPSADCLTAAERKVIATVYAPATNAGGRAVYPGQPYGGESQPGGWAAWITGSDTGLMRRVRVPNLQAMFSIEGGKYLTFGDSAWDYSRYDVKRWPMDARRLSAMLDADDPNLARFAAHKGKLILWHGWADPALNPLATVEYYGQVAARDPAAREYVRLFMMPGVLHCAGGAGPSGVAWLQAIVDWVEKESAPERLVATKRDKGAVVLTRPLCAYPLRAVYSGQGSTGDEKNFMCQKK